MIFAVKKEKDELTQMVIMMLLRSALEPQYIFLPLKT